MRQGWQTNKLSSKEKGRLTRSCAHPPFIVLSFFLFQPKKYLEFSLKSPGIKPSSHRHASSSKSHGIPPNVSMPKTSEEEDSLPSPMCVTPPTPSTPQTPPPHGASMSNVFPGKWDLETACYCSCPREVFLDPLLPWWKAVPHVRLVILSLVFFVEMNLLTQFKRGTEWRQQIGLKMLK